MEDWLGRDAAKFRPTGRVSQRGMGLHAFCEDCNSYTGGNYVRELKRWVDRGAHFLGREPMLQLSNKAFSTRSASLVFHNVDGLAFSKQLVTMVLAANPPEFGDANPVLRDFVLDKRRAGLPSEYRLYLNLYRGPASRRSAMTKKINRYDASVAEYSEVAHFPFSYVLGIADTAPPVELGDITHLSESTYGSVSSVFLKMIVGFGNTPLPCDYRTKSRIDFDALLGEVHLGSGRNS